MFEEMSTLRRTIAWVEISASPNHRKVMKTEPSRLVPWQRVAHLQLLTTRIPKCFGKMCHLWMVGGRITLSMP